MNPELVVQIKLELLKMAAQVASTKPGFDENDIQVVFEKLSKMIFSNNI